MKRKTIENMQVMAKLRGGECLSKEYVNCHSELDWKCKNNHKWIACPNNIQQGSWCPKCRSNDLAKAYKSGITKMRTIARLKGGKCLSQKYVRSSSKLRWRCANGHEWEATPAHVNEGRWCPYCSGSYGEELCRFIVTQLTRKLFIKNRDILGGLELDGYCDDLRVAFEYQGEQHYNFIKYWHKTVHSFRKQQKRDRVKIQLCELEDISLIIIPYYKAITKEELLLFIREKLKTIGVYCFGRVDFTLFNGYQDKLKELQELASSKGGLCLADCYEGMHIKVQWKCTKGHIWQAVPASIKYRSSWCPFCSLHAQPDIEVFQRIAQSRGGCCLSNKYTNNRTKLKFKCHNKHVWFARPSHIKEGHWCASCSHEKVVL